MHYGSCGRLNETVCALTQLPTTGTTTGTTTGSVDIVVWNSMAQARNELITVPVSSLDVVVTHNGTRVTDVQTYAAEETITNYKRNTNETLFVASFMAELPPVGYSVYTLTVGAATPFPTTKVSTNSTKKVSTPTPTPPPTFPSTFSGKAFSIENQHVMVNFSANGLMSGLTNKANGIYISLHQSFCYYIR